MSMVASDAEPPLKVRGVSVAAKFGLTVYQQVAAVLAAFGLAAVVGHFWHVGWRGFLATLVGVWDQTVRPVARQVLHVLVIVPLGWVGVYVVLPTWFSDYLSVGAILALSYVRTAGCRTGRNATLEEAMFSIVPVQSRLREQGWRWYIFTVTYVVLFWPAASCGAAVALIGRTVTNSRDLTKDLQRRERYKAYNEGGELSEASRTHWESIVAERSALRAQIRSGQRAFILVISPVVYLCVLLIINLLTGEWRAL
jgi:hypothetical protein